MTATEQFNFAHVISKGMSKQAVRLIGGGNPVVEDFVSAREALKKMLLAGVVGIGAGAAGAMALNHKSANVKQANPLTEVLGKGLGFLGGGGARVGAGAVNAGVLGLNKAVQGGGAALRTAGKVMTHPMHLPNNGLGKGLRQGWEAAWNLGNKSKVPPVPPAAAPKLNLPGLASTTYPAGRTKLPGLEAPTATHTGTSPIPEAVRSNPAYMAPKPGFEYENTTGNNAGVSAPTADEYANATGTNAGVVAPPASSRNWVADRWNGLKPWQRNTAIAGGAAAATANTASVYGNNTAADWQQEHPLMGWLGKTFGGMPDYQRKSYMLPSFLQH